MNVIIKILGGLVVVFLMFLPVAGCENTNDYNVSGAKLLEGIFKSGEGDASTVLFFLSISCGIVIIFLRKHLLSMIFAAGGILSFLSAYIYVKSKNGMDIVELKIGAFLAIMAFIAIIVMSIIKMVTANKSASPLQFQQPQPIPPPPPVSQQNQQAYQQYMPPPPQTQYVPPQPPQQARPKFCTKCGFKFPETFQGKFCTSCGNKII